MRRLFPAIRSRRSPGGRVGRRPALSSAGRLRIKQPRPTSTRMAPKPASLALLSDSGEPSPVEVSLSPRPANPIEAWVRRAAGEGPLNLIRARGEVLASLRSSSGEVPAAGPLDDALPPSAIPSVAAGCFDDRVLAEVDQDGFAFATSPTDVPFFD